MDREALDPATRRRFQTGRPCLDFVHTGGVGRWVAAELVHDAADADVWLALVLGLEDGAVRTRPADLARLRRLREAIWQLAQAATTGSSFAAEHVDTVNEAAQEAPPRVALTSRGERSTLEPVGARAALSALARDAIDLFAGPLRHRVRTCAADDCEMLFVDASRPGGRRWCSMGRCGTRAKMRRYRGAAVGRPSDPRRRRAVLGEWGERGLTRAQASALLREHGLAPQTAGGWARGGWIETRADGGRYATARARRWLRDQGELAPGG